jgi:hypothetical protein
MPEIRGLVQRIKLVPDIPDFVWVYIGPSPTNTTLFAINLDGAHPANPEILRRRSMIETLNGALFARREVIVYTEEGSYDIYNVEVVSG